MTVRYQESVNWAEAAKAAAEPDTEVIIEREGKPWLVLMSVQQWENLRHDDAEDDEEDAYLLEAVREAEEYNRTSGEQRMDYDEFRKTLGLD